MIDIKLEESTRLTLEMNIEGAQDANPQLRFSVMVEGFRMSFDGKAKADGLYEIEFPKLIGRVTEGQYAAEVEVIVDGKHFSPLTETVNFTREVKPTVSFKEKLREAEAMSVKVANVHTIAAAPVVSDIRSLLAMLNTGGDIDSNFALRCIDALAANRELSESRVTVRPSKALSENEAIVALRLLSQRGSDLDRGDLVMENIVKVSPKVSTLLRDVLVEKGISARTLKELGL